MELDIGGTLMQMTNYLEKKMHLNASQVLYRRTSLHTLKLTFEGEVHYCLHFSGFRFFTGKGC